MAHAGIVKNNTAANVLRLLLFLALFALSLSQIPVFTVRAAGTDLNPTKTLEGGVTTAQVVVQGWSQIGATVILGTLTLTTLTADFTSASTVEAEILKLEAQLTDKRNLRDAANTALWDKVKRARTTIKGIYGDDSSQHEMVGGTRASERKAPTQKKPKHNDGSLPNREAFHLRSAACLWRI